MDGEQIAGLFALVVLAVAALYLAWLFSYGPKP